MRSSLAVLIFLALAACGDESSPTATSLLVPIGPPPQARVDVDRLSFDVGIQSISPPKLWVDYELRIRETAGVRINPPDRSV